MHGDETTTDTRSSDLGLVEGDRGRSETDGKTRDDTTNAEHTSVNGGALQNTADNPDPSRQNDGFLAANPVREETDDESSDERARGHGRHDGTLGVRAGIVERPLVGVILRYIDDKQMKTGEIRRETHVQHSGHGRNVQTEETATDTCE